MQTAAEIAAKIAAKMQQNCSETTAKTALFLMHGFVFLLVVSIARSCRKLQLNRAVSAEQHAH